MGKIKETAPVKLIMGIIARDECRIKEIRTSLTGNWGDADLFSPVIPFNLTSYYEEEMGKAKVPVFHIPTVLGAVVLSYNLPSIKTPLNLTGDLVAEIYLGKITKWNDAKIAEINKGVKLPETDILVAYRSDGSGTTAIFTDYLSKVSKEWQRDPKLLERLGFME